MESNKDLFDNNFSLRDKVYEYLKTEIISGRLEPGARLPEVELSTSLNISRAPIREALSLLSKDGFVTNIPRRGAIVSLITSQDVKNNWEVRSLVEPYATSVACGNIPQKRLTDTYKLLGTILNCPDDYEVYMDSDFQLHNMIYESVPNEQIKKILVSTMLSSQRFRYIAENNHPEKTSILLTITKEHIAIAEALLAEDCAQARAAMELHVKNGYERIKKKFD